MPSVRGNKGFVKKSVLEKLERTNKSPLQLGYVPHNDGATQTAKAAESCDVYLSFVERNAKLAFKALLRKGSYVGCIASRTAARSGSNMAPRRDVLCLFDVDGTLTAPRKVIDSSFYKFLVEDVKPHVCIGLVGGSDLTKVTEQMGGDKVLADFDFVFCENGVVAFKDGSEIGSQSIQSFLGEDKLQKFINYVLFCLSEIELPVKRGTFVEFRTGMLNISPIGRACSRNERDDFEKFDHEHHIRKKLIEKLKSRFPDFGLTYSIGGQISIDVFPTGWDKTYCLQFVGKESFKEIHFFGDKIDKGGNDYEIYNHASVNGHRVTSPEDTRQKVLDVLKAS